MLLTLLLNILTYNLCSSVYPDGRVCISILHAPGDDPMGYESSAERWSPVQSVEKILLSVVSMLAGTVLFFLILFSNSCPGKGFACCAIRRAWKLGVNQAIAWTGLEFSDLKFTPSPDSAWLNISNGLDYYTISLHLYVFGCNFLVTQFANYWCFSCLVFVTFVSVLCRTKWWKWCKCRCFSEYYMKSCSFASWAVDILHLKICLLPCSYHPSYSFGILYIDLENSPKKARMLIG